MEQARILAVDDDRFFRELYADMLSQEGYRVDAVANPTDCLDLLATNAYDLVILDLILENANGIELAQTIREQEPGLEIMMATKVDDLASINRALELGIKEYIIKPIKEPEFLQAVGRIIERQRLFLEHGRLLAESVEHIYTLSIYRRGLAILRHLALEPMVDELLAGGMQECEAVGAAVWVRDENDPSVFREADRRGLVDEAEPKEFSYSEYGQHEQLQAAVPFFPRLADGSVDRGIMHIPLICDRELLGLVKLFGKVDGRFRSRDLQTARMLGEFSAIALQNATAVRELKRRASRGENFILSLERFQTLIERERSTAMRYNRAFALVELRMPGGRGLLEGFLEEQLREADVVTEAARGNFKFFLPDTDGIGARSFARRLLTAMRAKGLLPQGEMPVPVHASFPADGESIAELESALRRRSAGVEESLVGRLSRVGFGALCDELLEAHGVDDDTFGKNGFVDIVHFLLADMESDPRRRSALFLGLGKVGAGQAWLEERFYKLGKQARVSLFGDIGDFRVPDTLENVAAIHVPVGSGGETMFAFYLTGESGYVALIQCDDNRRRVFHARDEYLADALILALQEQFYLQRQL